MNDAKRGFPAIARLDGANAWHRLIHITLPSIRNISKVVLIMTIIASFNVFAQPFLMTRGGPGYETTVLLMNIFAVAYGQHQGGAASAMAIVLGLIMMVVSTVTYRLLSGRKG
jgi:multiple sugar transport system permease protein